MRKPHHTCLQVTVKVFHKERERILHLLLDAGPTMHFDSRSPASGSSAVRPSTS